MPAFILPTDAIVKRAGSSFFVRVRMEAPPVGGVAGWSVEMQVCDPPGSFNFVIPAPTLEDPTLGIWLFAIDTAGWPAATYHLIAHRASPDPDDLWQGLLVLNEC